MKRAHLIIAIAIALAVVLAPSTQASDKDSFNKQAKKQIKTDMVNRVATAPEILDRYGHATNADSIEVTSFGYVEKTNERGEHVITYTANVYYKVKGDRHIAWVWHESNVGALNKRVRISLFQ